MLEPIKPEIAVELYLKDRRTELARSSLQNHCYRLERFLEWCEESGLDNMNDVTGRMMMEYKQWRAEDVKPITLHYQMGTVRVFIRFCEQIDGVEQGVSEKILLPSINEDDETRDTLLLASTAGEIQAYLRKFEYASFRHALFEVLWHSGVRVGTAQAFDVDDFNREEKYVAAVHRPKQGTPLKNKEKGQRQINLSNDVCEVIEDYLDNNHPHVEDEFGRVALFGTRTGRAGKTVLQKNIYAVTRPCHYSNECPHGRVIGDCEAANVYDSATKCPSSLSPHPIRRGAITEHLNADVPMEITSDRMNVSRKILKKHYDGRTEPERRKQRRDYLEEM